MCLLQHLLTFMSIWCGVTVLCRYGGRLVGEITTRPISAKVSELQFANDLAAVGTSMEGNESAAQLYYFSTGCFGSQDVETRNGI